MADGTDVATKLRGEYSALKSLIELAHEDVEKVANGQKAAGTRLRKTLQEVKTKAQALRGVVMEARNVAPKADA